MSKFEEGQRLMAFRVYVTDMLYYLPNGETLTYRYADLINNKIHDEVTEDNVLDIVYDIIEKAELEVV